MNILFFLVPKSKVEFVSVKSTLRQTIEKLDIHGYTAIPILNEDGKYINTISEGDLLHYIKNKHNLDLLEAEDIKLTEVPISRTILPITANSSIDDLLDLALKQNFVPVVDDLGSFIGIITRSDILNYLFKEKKNG